MKNKKPKNKKVLDDVEKYCQRHTPTAKHPLLFSENFSQKIRIRAFSENPQYWTSAKYFHICLFLHQNKEIGNEAYFFRKSAKNTQFFVFLNRSSLCYEIAKIFHSRQTNKCHCSRYSLNPKMPLDKGHANGIL